MRKTWKTRFAAALLAGVLAVSGAGTASAAEIWEKKNVSYKNIEEIVEGSLDFSGASAQVEAILSSLSQAQASLAGLSQKLDLALSQTPSGAMYDILAALKLNTETLKGQISLSIASYGQSAGQISQAEDQVVTGLKTLYVAYNSLSDQRSELSRSLGVLEANLEAYRLQYELGMITKLDLDKMEENKAALSSGIATMDTELRNLRRTFNTTLGRNYDEGLTIGSVPRPDLEYVKEISFKKDLEYVVSSYGAGSSIPSNFEDYDETKDATGASFRKLYESISEKQRLLEREQQTLELQARSLDAAKLQAEVGLLSPLGLVNAQDQYDTQAAKVKTAQNNLFLAIEQYKWAVDYGIFSS